MPGGFRLGENSDFGLVEPDGTPRPSAHVMAAYNPRFAGVRHLPADATLAIDLDTERYHAWELYSPRYLEMVKSGKVVALTTAGTGTTSADCPMVAVGGNACNGKNPPQFLNAEFDTLEVSVGGTWRSVRSGDTIEAPRGSVVRCRATVGNTGEAEWLSPERRPGSGAVYLTVSNGVRAPIAADTPYLGTTSVREFDIVAGLNEAVTLSLRMEAAGRTPFGERRTVTLVPR